MVLELTASGLVVGLAFGFFLQKTFATKRNVIVDMLLLRDLTLYKFMFTAIGVSAIGFYTLSQIGLKLLTPKPMTDGVVLGAVLFGLGWAIAGWCPGTCTAAIAEAKYLALVGVAGLLLGAAAHAESYAFLADLMKGKATTLPQVLGINPLLTAMAFGLALLATAVLLDRRLS